MTVNTETNQPVTIEMVCAYLCDGLRRTHTPILDGYLDDPRDLVGFYVEHPEQIAELSTGEDVMVRMCVHLWNGFAPFALKELGQLDGDLFRTAIDAIGMYARAIRPEVTAA